MKRDYSSGDKHRPTLTRKDKINRMTEKKLSLKSQLIQNCAYSRATYRNYKMTRLFGF
jgi:hypothetical protein